MAGKTLGQWFWRTKRRQSWIFLRQSIQGISARKASETLYLSFLPPVKSISNFGTLKPDALCDVSLDDLLIFFSHIDRISTKLLHQGVATCVFHSFTGMRRNEIFLMLNPISTGLFCLVVALGGGGGGCFPPPSITPLSLKLDCSNFVRKYFQIAWTICDEKIRIKSTMTSLWRHIFLKWV